MDQPATSSAAGLFEPTSPDSDSSRAFHDALSQPASRTSSSASGKSFHTAQSTVAGDTPLRNSSGDGGNSSNRGRAEEEDRVWQACWGPRHPLVSHALHALAGLLTGIKVKAILKAQVQLIFFTLLVSHVV